MIRVTIITKPEVTLYTYVPMRTCQWLLGIRSSYFQPGSLDNSMFMKRTARLLFDTLISTSVGVQLGRHNLRAF